MIRGDFLRLLSMGVWALGNATWRFAHPSITLNILFHLLDLLLEVVDLIALSFLLTHDWLAVGLVDRLFATGTGLFILLIIHQLGAILVGEVLLQGLHLESIAFLLASNFVESEELLLIVQAYLIFHLAALIWGQLGHKLLFLVDFGLHGILACESFLGMRLVVFLLAFENVATYSALLLLDFGFGVDAWLLGKSILDNLWYLICTFVLYGQFFYVLIVNVGLGSLQLQQFLSLELVEPLEVLRAHLALVQGYVGVENLIHLHGQLIKFLWRWLR